MKQKHIAITAAVAAVAVVLIGGIGLASIGLFGGESEKATPEKATPESSLSAKDEPIQDAKPQANASDESGDAVPLPHRLPARSRGRRATSLPRNRTVRMLEAALPTTR